MSSAKGDCIWQCAAWIVTVAVLVILCVRLQTSVVSPNPGSRIATIDSLVYRRTWAIDNSRYGWTIDKVRLGDRFLSTKLPLLPAATAVVFGKFSTYTGVSFDTNEAMAVGFISFVSGVVPYIFLLFFVWGLCRLFASSRVNGDIAYILFASGFVGLGYATGINDVIPAAAALSGCFFFACRIWRGDGGRWTDWAACGILGGLAPTLGIWTFLFLIGFAVRLIITDWRRSLILAAPLALLPIVIHFSLAYASTGFLLPLYGRGELYSYAGSFWLNPEGMDALRENKVIYLFHMLFGHHGVFSMMPVLLFAFAGIILSLRRGGKLRTEAYMVLVPSVTVIAVFSLITRNYGGSCIGMRWMFFFIPLYFPFLAPLLVSLRKRFLWITLLLLFSLIGSLQMLDTVSGHARAWQFGCWHRLLASYGMGSLDSEYIENHIP